MSPRPVCCLCVTGSITKGILPKLLHCCCAAAMLQVDASTLAS